ncbi:MAG: alkaline phosphatase family protein [Ignavibacteria bacterium]|nr:alkaline phosphatase family protein [Ignavibacteria bacterium]
MKRKTTIFVVIVLLLCVISAIALYRIYSSGPKPPKLVIGIVVDQMAYDFIPRYWDKYSDNGFKKIINNGFFCKNANYIHFPAYTAPGHSCIYTGTVPAINGISGNDWLDRGSAQIRYCADDSTVRTVGSYSEEGKMSPSSLMTTTITDRLKYSSNMKSKVIGIALKDRGGIYPAGHTANAAYWYDASSKNWVTSTYYMPELPSWVKDFNTKDLQDEYFKQKWNTLFPIENYTESIADDNEFEDTFKGELKPVFPHNLPELKYKNPNLLRYSPFGNTMTKEFALDVLKNEKMGLGENTDFLCISFSSTDYVGHMYGPNSIETEDTYLRLDKDLAEFLGTVDMTIGMDNTLVFLTADHGVCSNPEYLKSTKLNAGTFLHTVVIDSVNNYLLGQYGIKNLVRYFLNQQIFLNRELVLQSGLNIDDVSGKVSLYIKNNIPGVRSVFTSAEIKSGKSSDPYFEFFKNGFYESRCGEVFVNFQPYWIEDRVRGSEHGSPYEYDTHVPLVFYGWKIPKGELNEPVKMTDVTPTMAALLGIQPPEGCIGRPIKEITEKLAK